MKKKPLKATHRNRKTNTQIAVVKEDAKLTEVMYLKTKHRSWYTNEEFHKIFVKI